MKVLVALMLAVLLPHSHLQVDFSTSATTGPDHGTRVESVVNGMAKLPCDLSSETDSVTLVIWYRALTDVPLYTLDARGRSLDNAAHWVDQNAFTGRAYLRVSDNIAHLVLDRVGESDSGHYRCRVDFKKSPTRNSLVDLLVVVPPKRVRIMNDAGELITRPLVGPYMEGDMIRLMCLSEGGSPLPHLSWWVNSELVDDSCNSGEDPIVVENEITIGPLGREHAGRVYTCHAANNDLFDPVVTDVKIDMFLRVLDVRLIGENLAVSAGSEYEVACQATGSRPQVTITWWKAGLMMDQVREKTSPDGNVTVSTLTMVPSIEDEGKSLSCRANNPKVVDSVMEDTWTLQVHYAPIVKLNLGSNINSSSIREGVDVYMECTVRANPPLHKLAWKLNGQTLNNSITSGVIIANQTLVLQSISRLHSGHYTCVATNPEGVRESNSFHLDVKYEPECRRSQKVVYGAARTETLQVFCDVDANPPALMFRWTFNNSAEREKELIDFTTAEGGGRSVALYSPTQGYGTLLCWGRNELGIQAVPCVFHIVPAGKPESPRNCTLRNKTQTALFVSCVRGFDGGLPQEFILEVYSASGRLVVNQSSRVEPEFSVDGLEPGEAYVLNVYSGNAKGRSGAVVSVQVTTLRPTQQEHRRNIPTPAPTISILSISTSPLVWIVVGVLSGAIFVTLLLLVVWRIRGGCRSDRDEDEPYLSSTTTESGEGKLAAHLGRGKPAAQPIPPVSTARITAHDCIEMDDRNPDVIPFRNDADQGSRSNLTDDLVSRCWKSSSDLQLPTSAPSTERTFSHHLSKHNLAYEVPAHLDKWTIQSQTQWPSDQQPPAYNLLLNKQNMVLMDTPSPLVLTTLAIDSTVLASGAPEGSDVSLNPCILLKQPSEHSGQFVQVLAASAEQGRLFNKLQLQNAQTQTPHSTSHKESAV